MSNEVRKKSKSSLLKSSVGKMAILAAAAMSLSSCTTSTYWNSYGYREGIQSSGFTGGETVDVIYAILDVASGHKPRRYSRSKCRYGTVGNRGGRLGNY